MADVSDPRIAEAVQLVRDDNSPENWATFGYEGKTKIVVDGTGSGGHAELMDHLPEDSAKFALLRLDDGDRESKRVKFVFLTFTGDHAPQLVKARLATHTSSIKPLLGLCHTDFRADNARECTEALIRKKLKAAAGADYDSGSNASGYQSSGNIKERALKAYQQKEKEGNIKSVIYVTSALPNTTPVDLSNRPTVAPPTEAKKNIRDNVNDIKKFEGTGTSTIKKKAGAEFEEKKAGTKSATATPSPAAKPGTRPSVSIKPSIDVIGSSGSSSSTTDAADDAPVSPKKPVAARKPTPAANKPEIKKKPEPSTLSPAPEGSEFRERIGSILNEDLPDDEEERARIRAEKRRSQRADIEQKAKDEVSQLTQQLLSKPVSPKPARKEEPEEEEQQQEEEEEKENDDEEEERAREKAEKEKKEKAEKEKKEKAEKEKKEKAEKEAKEKKEKEAKEKAEKEKKEKAEKEKKEKAEKEAKEKKEKEAKEKAEKDAKKKSSLFDDDDDEEDLFSKPTKPAPKKAENLFDSMDKQLEEDPEEKEEEKKEEEEEEKPAEVDHRTVTVPYVMLTMLLIKHDILSSDFDGTPEELVQFIENAVENM